jgi:Tol biopolymer transport system component
MNFELAHVTFLVVLTLAPEWSVALSQDFGFNETNTPLRRFIKVSAQRSDSVIISPDKKKALFTLTYGGRKELWVMNINGTGKKKISNVKKDEGVMSPVWSPDGKLIAFVSYNLAGHSPMTTMNVWIVRSDGRGVKKVVLPRPNQRFSTYDPLWKANGDLIVKAMTLGDSLEQRYLYTYRTGKIQKINQQR